MPPRSISARAADAVRPPSHDGRRGDRPIRAPQHDTRARRRGVDADKIARFQLRDLKALIKGRYGDTLPDEIDDPDLEFGAVYLSVAARLCPSYCSNISGWVTRQAEKWAPGWVNQVAAIVSAVQVHPHRLTGDGIAGMLNVSIEERDRLRLRNIGAIDMAAADRKRRSKKLKKLRDKERAAERRRAKGAQTRVAYLAAHSLRRTKPWDAAGVSRAKWYADKAAA
jgi:hypothetical protein